MKLYSKTIQIVLLNLDKDKVLNKTQNCVLFNTLLKRFFLKNVSERNCETNTFITTYVIETIIFGQLLIFAVEYGKIS